MHFLHSGYSAQLSQRPPIKQEFSDSVSCTVARRKVCTSHFIGHRRLVKMAPSDIEHTAMDSNSASSQGDATIETVAAQLNSQAGAEQTVTDEAMDSSVGAPTPNHKGDYHGQLRNYVRATNCEEPYFGEFGTLQRLNIVHIQIQLAELHSELNERPPTNGELRNLRGLIQDYSMQTTLKGVMY